MTYNVHRCIGLDRRTSPARIAAVIAESLPDIAALQELPGGRYRPETTDLTLEVVDELARLGLKHPYSWLERERCGNVIISRHPLRLVRAGGLHSVKKRRSLVPRGVLWVEADMCGFTLQVINTHLGITPGERSSQARILSGHEWLLSPECRPPIVLCGDFNALPGSAVHERLGAILQDVQVSLACRHVRTWPSRYPFMRIDHMFVSTCLDPISAEIPQSHLARVASDHLPLVVCLRNTQALPLNLS